MAYLELAGLEKRYRDAVAVADVTLAVEKGESVALLGPSGCGKTTTLRMLAGLVAPDRGSIAVDGADITTMPAHKRNMGYVFQSYALFPHMTVEKNVAFGLEERGVTAKERKDRVATALDKVRLNELSHRRPRELSGGQQQRVALARALVIRPTVLLLDESLSNLDAKLRQTMRREIRDLQRSLAITTLFVTHDQVEALAMCDRIAVMNRGRIEQVGSPTDVYERPATRFVASFVGSVNVLPASRDGGGNLLVWGAAVPGAKSSAGGDMDVFVRPQRMRLVAASEPVSPGTPHLQGKVEQNIFIGDQIETVVTGAGGGQLTVQNLSGASVPGAGTDVKVVWKPEDTLVFAREAS
jgi:putative spermidine/putrescine transport system ATP-binding protein